MPSSFEAMHDETRSLAMLEAEAEPASLPRGLTTLLSAVLVVLPIVIGILL